MSGLRSRGRGERRYHLRTLVGTALALVTEHLPGEPGRELATSLIKQPAWIVDAAALQAEGEVVGSGMVEKTVDLVINRWLKGRRGMR